MNLYEILEYLQISYDEVEHPAVFTVKEAEKIKEKISGVGCKCLFLTDNKGFYLLYLLKDDKRANLSYLANFFHVSHLSFASEEELARILHLKPGSVSPFGILFDSNYKVLVGIDADLKEETVLVHPNINTKTLSLSLKSLLTFVTFTHHQYVFIDDELKS